MSCFAGTQTRVTAVLLIFLAAAIAASAQQTENLNDYKWRVDSSWWFSQPTGSIRAANNTGYFDLSKDFDFGSYSTYSGQIDRHFKRKHHFLLAINPVTSDKTRNVARDIEFEGVTYHAGAQVSAEIRSLAFSPGYQYDILRRNHGYLGISAQLLLIDTKATLKGIGAVNGVSAVRSASGSVFAPLPVFGPDGRWYPIHNSNRIALDGFIRGMYLFGYGDFLSARGTIVVTFHPHWSFIAGYQMGQDLSIHGGNDQLGVKLIQKGPIAGIETSW
jgi:hypothetical protein